MTSVRQRTKYGLLSALIGTAVVALVGADLAFGASNSHESENAFGCAPDRVAVAHYQGGVVVASPPPGEAKKAPVPCSAATGWRTNEMGIAVTSTGTVVISPTFPESGTPIGLIRSTDNGASWQSIVPVETPPRTDQFDSSLGIDSKTGRMFYVTPGYFTAQYPETAGLWVSDDDGETWSVGAGATMLPPSGRTDQMKIFAGPPTPISRDKMKAYPNVVYNCGGHKPFRCQASRDGGLSWSPVIFLPFPSELASIQGPKNDCSAFGENGVVGKDGTVYIGYTPCNRPYVAISRDEAQTWQAVKVADVETVGFGLNGVAIDEAGTLYAAWVAAADRLPYLSISRDRGETWSSPVMVGAPGVKEAALPKVVAGKAGQVAVAYYGSQNSPGAPFPDKCTNGPTSCPAYKSETWNMYITETFDAVRAQPVFWSAAINDPAVPASYGCIPSSTGVVRLDEGNPFVITSTDTVECWFVMDYIAMQMSEDGTPWVGFPQMCLGVPGNPNCPDTFAAGAGGDPDSGGSNSVGLPTGMYFAMFGRLVSEHEDSDVNGSGHNDGNDQGRNH